MIQIAYPIILAAFIAKSLDPEGRLRKRLAEEARNRTTNKNSHERTINKRSERRSRTWTSDRNPRTGWRRRLWNLQGGQEKEGKKVEQDCHKEEMSTSLFCGISKKTKKTVIKS